MKQTINYTITLIFLILAINQNQLSAQTSLCLGQDATVCLGTNVTLQNCGAAPGSGSQGIVLNTPSSVTLSDDQWSPAVNIGFNFDFYGTTYTQLTIGSNCLLSFNIANAGGYCPWNLQTAGTMPSTTFTSAHNSIMSPYQDINPNTFTSPNGAIQYETIGTAPNRAFIVLYKDINFFSCTSVCNYIAIILYEGTNNIETHIGDKPLCSTWNGGLAIHGTQNDGGTNAHIVTGRNNTQWAANQEGTRWTPTTPANTTNYTISTVPYILVTSPNTSFQWENTLGQTFPYNGGTLNINPVLPGNTGYFLSGSACGASLGSVSDTTWINGVQSGVSAAGTDDICSVGQGTVTATPTQGTGPYTYDWTTLGNATTQTVTGVFAGTHTVVMTDSFGCTSTANVTIGDTPASFTGDSTLVSCPGGNDGTATATMAPVLGTVTYQWDDPAMQTTQTATGLTAGTYNCIVSSDIGCVDTVTVQVVEIPGMIGVIANQSDVTCNSGNDGVIDVDITQGTAPYTYSWDNSASTSDIATDLAAGTHTVTITDANGCVITVTGTIGEPAPLDITSLTPDTQICPEDDIMLTVVPTGGSSAYIYTWTENGNPLAQTGATITVDPAVTNTQYCVTLSEACGSPTDQECMIVTFPTPIEPSVVPDEPEKCMPGFFEFTHTSSNAGEIATTYFDFGDFDGTALEQGDDSTSYTYNAVGIFDVIVTTTSIYGCVYTDTMKQIVEVKPNPVADFTFSSNPATVFETTVLMQDRSSADVIQHDWYSPFSSPTTSNLTNPQFVFPEEVGTYPVRLAVVTEHGCVDTIIFHLNVVQDILFFAPNAFTPDGDEHNQNWKPQIQGIDVHDFELLIFNRWGQVIWENHDPNVGWDGTFNGKIVETGAYTWKATVKDLYNDDKRTFNGMINLLK